MKSVNEFLGERNLAHLYQWMEETEKSLIEKNIDPDKFLLKKLEEQQVYLEFDPLTMGVGALGLYGAQQGLKHLGGWQGLKNVAKTGWDAMKQGGQDMLATRNTSMDTARRADAHSAAAAAGGTVTLPQKDPAEISNYSAWADRNKAVMDRTAADLQSVFGNDPQITNITQQMSALYDALKTRLNALPGATSTVP